MVDSDMLIDGKVSEKKQKQIDYGKRDFRSNRLRLLSILFFPFLIIMLEMTLGRSIEKQKEAELIASADNWGIAEYHSSFRERDIPEKPHEVKRLIYISNSHAKTGGHVAKHLQHLLDLLSPGRFEVIDLAEPGIFAPDMLQRTLKCLDFKPDLIILGVSYISFSDRMKLSLQSHGTRSFFKKGIFSRLPIGFWIRNYDIGIYCDTFITHFSSLYRNRNRLRDLWEKPSSQWLKQISSDRRTIVFLEIDENKSWRFPEGYDNNLFQWNLYASGRRGHLCDIRDLTRELEYAEIPLLALNMPVDFGKSLYAYDKADYQRYRRELKDLFEESSLEYVDYEGFFPKSFTTYDALHPTWHGARLHALDISLRLKKHGFLPASIKPEAIVRTFSESEPAISQAYQDALDGNYPRLKGRSFRRFDLSEPENARILMSRLAGLPPGSKAEIEYLYSLSLRIRYWQESFFSIHDCGSFEETTNRLWQHAFHEEVNKARNRMDLFKKKLAAFQSERLKMFPLPRIKNQVPVSQRHMKINKRVLVINDYQIPESFSTVASMDGDVFAYIIENKDGRYRYNRVDILGDHSFLLLQLGDVPVLIPDQIRNAKPKANWGI